MFDGFLYRPFRGLSLRTGSLGGRGVITWDAVLTSAGDTVGGTTSTTASITPLANKATYAFVTGCVAAGTSSAPTAAGNGMTWVQVASIAQATRTLTVFRAANASPSAGTLVFDFGGQAQVSSVWFVVQGNGIDTGGANAANSVVQAVTKTGTATTTTTNSLAALEYAGNHHLCVIQAATAIAITPDADFVELADQSTTASNIDMECQYAANQVDCTPTWTSSGYSMISLEIKASA